jgi:acyl transferase domain-containing protein
MRDDIAIIGLAGRFPGARNVEQLWRNVCDGVEAIRFLDEAELRRAGVPRERLADPGYVPAAPALAGFDAFDAALFECSPMEARLMDPQQRVLLEVAWETLEDAGYDATSYRGSIGVFAGSGGSASSYLISDVHVHHALRGPTGSLQHVSNDKDFLAGRVAYKLDLRGPSVTVQAACATAIVAIQLACRAVQHGECDMALAGGVAIRVPHLAGYVWEAGGIWSRDGHCRPFDSDGSGTVFGSGAGLVLVKPLRAALADGDRVHAVIKGVAINNDGGQKLSFAVASGDGVTRAAQQALAAGGVAPSTVGLVMAHANGNPMGDALEFQALGKAFKGDQVGAVALSSVKGNIGHPEQASGMASLAVAIHALRHQTIPPTLHCATPSPRLRLSRSPFVIGDRPRPWPEAGTPRRAGVSSIAIGGTNAFLLVEEAPRTPPPAPADDAAPGVPRLLRVSAQTDAALRQLALRFADALEVLDAADLADFCFTANVGRRRLRRQIAVVGQSPHQIADALRAFAAGTPSPRVIAQPGERVADQAAMLVLGDVAPTGHRDALAHSRAFADAVARCEQACGAPHATSLRAVIAGDAAADGDVGAVAAFAAAYAYGELLAGVGVEVAGVVGSGAGRHAAACLRDATLLPGAIDAVLARVTGAGSLEDELVRARSRGCAVFVAVGAVAASAVAGDSWIRLASGAQPTGAYALIEAIARLAAHGVAVGAGALEGAARRRRVAVPGYPFESQRYWVDAAVAPAEPGPTPGLRRVRSPALRDVVIEGRLDRLLPASGYCDRVRQAASMLVGDSRWSVVGLSLREPRALTGAGARIVQLIARPRGADGWAFEVVSSAEDGEGAWCEHAQGVLRVDAAAARDDDEVDLAAIRARCSQALDGPGLPGGRRVMRGEGEAVTELTGPAGDEIGGLAVLEACRQVAHAIAPPLGDGEAYHSTSVESVRIHAGLGSEVTCHVVLHGPISERSDHFAVDVSIYAGSRLAVQVGAWRWKRSRIASRPGIAGRTAIVEELAAAPSRVRRSRMMALVEDQVRQALGAGPHERIGHDEGFRDRGLDSMTSVQLRKTLQELLGVPLSNTLTFNHPNLRALSEYLLASLFPVDEEHRSSEAAGEASVAMEDLETAIESELETLERVLGAT